MTDKEQFRQMIERAADSMARTPERAIPLLLAAACQLDPGEVRHRSIDAGQNLNFELHLCYLNINGELEVLT